MVPFPPPRSVPDQPLKPDGRQTRIDFFRTGKPPKDGAHVQSMRPRTFEWWHAITAWIRQGRPGQDRRLDEFRVYLEGRGYSNKTCESYVYMLKKFFTYLEEWGVSELTMGEIEDYNYEFFIEGGYSRSYQLQFINALRLYITFSYGVRVSLRHLRKSRGRR